MLNTFRITRYVHGQLTGGPTRNYAGSVGICVGGVVTLQPTECRSVGPVSLVDVAAFGALLTGIPRIDRDQRDASESRLVGEECVQLSECPTVENRSLLLPFTIPDDSDSWQLQNTPSANALRFLSMAKASNFRAEGISMTAYVSAIGLRFRQRTGGASKPLNVTS